MRTEGSRPSASASTRLRHELTRARTWLRGRGRITRLALVAVAGAALVAAAFLAIPADRDEPVWLYDRPLSGDAALAIRKALFAEKIPFRSDAAHRIGVAASRWGDAMTALEKHGVAPASLEEIESAPPTPSPWIGQAEKLEQDRWRTERRLKATIEGYGAGIRSASVSILRSQVRDGLRPEWKMSGLVILDVERRPPHKVLCSIQTLLARSVPGLSPDAVTVGDRLGNFFFEAGNPRAASTTKNLARGEELRDALLEKLGPLIPGIDLDVIVDPPAPAEAVPAVVTTPTKPSAPADEATRPNVPVGLEPEPEPRPTPPGVPPSGAGRATVWVKVPRSYYQRLARDVAPGRTPSQDELKVYDQKTRDLIDNAVSVLIPPAERGRLMVNTIADNLAPDPAPAVASGPAVADRAWPSWLAPAALGAGAGLAVALVLGTGFGLIASRRPSARPSRTNLRSGLVVDAPSGPVPGPSERVRDLVRRDPEAAAGVLQRWIGKADGGPAG